VTAPGSAQAQPGAEFSEPALAEPPGTRGSARQWPGADALLLAVAVSVAIWAGWARWHPDAPGRAIPPGAEVRQWSTTTCGPAAVATILNIYRCAWKQEALERECGLAAAGTSLYGLREACRRHGLEAEGMRATGPRGLLRVPRPYIAYLSSGHFVVVERLRAGRLEVFDPTAGGVTAWTVEQLYQWGDGWILAVDSPQ
jgi:hypothetical protein